MEPKYIVLIVIILLALIYIKLYNNIVDLRNRCENAWQTIDTQLQRRLDLIPNLVETVKGYAKHESSTLEAVINARNSVASAATPTEKMEADNQLTGTLRQLFALSESYPDLKANTNFQQLQKDLSDTENRISYARQSFNDCVYKYNVAIETFPGNIVASIAKFERKTGFVAEETAQSAPSVKF